MKRTLGIVVLVILCIGLVVALVVGKNRSEIQQKKDADTIFEFSNQLTTANADLDKLRQVNLILTNDLDASRRTLITYSNQYVVSSATLSNTEAALQGAQTQISDLEARNRALDQRAAEMTNTIANLSAQITETQMKLVTSETNNAFLESELKHQLAQRAELERKFNDLSQVRAQVRKLRNEMFVARRLKWMREGTEPGGERKGAQLLMMHAMHVHPRRNVGPAHYDLNVEVSSDGSVQVIPAATNAPAASSPQ